jgi:hypothetical protein
MVATTIAIPTVRAFSLQVHMQSDNSTTIVVVTACALLSVRSYKMGWYHHAHAES